MEIRVPLIKVGGPINSDKLLKPLAKAFNGVSSLYLTHRTGPQTLGVQDAAWHFEGEQVQQDRVQRFYGIPGLGEGQLDQDVEMLSGGWGRENPTDRRLTWFGVIPGTYMPGHLLHISGVAIAAVLERQSRDLNSRVLIPHIEQPTTPRRSGYDTQDLAFAFLTALSERVSIREEAQRAEELLTQATKLSPPTLEALIQQLSRHLPPPTSNYGAT